MNYIFYQIFSENWKIWEATRSLMQILGKLVFFEKLEKIKTHPSPLSQAILTVWPKGGSSAIGIHGSREGFYDSSYISAVGIQIPCNNIQTN
jgi:hypothetical protein